MTDDLEQYAKKKGLSLPDSSSSSMMAQPPDSSRRTQQQAYKDFRKELESRGVRINSGYRTRAQQEALYRRLPKGQAARPGTSEHERWGAVDLPPGVKQSVLEEAAKAAGVRLKPRNVHKGTGWHNHQGFMVDDGQDDAPIFDVDAEYAKLKEQALGDRSSAQPSPTNPVTQTVRPPKAPSPFAPQVPPPAQTNVPPPSAPLPPTSSGYIAPSLNVPRAAVPPPSAVPPPAQKPSLTPVTDALKAAVTGQDTATPQVNQPAETAYQDWLKRNQFIETPTNRRSLRESFNVEQQTPVDTIVPGQPQAQQQTAQPVMQGRQKRIPTQDGGYIIRERGVGTPTTNVDRAGYSYVVPKGTKEFGTKQLRDALLTTGELTPAQVDRYIAARKADGTPDLTRKYIPGESVYIPYSVIAEAKGTVTGGNIIDQGLADVRAKREMQTDIAMEQSQARSQMPGGINAPMAPRRTEAEAKAQLEQQYRQEEIDKRTPTTLRGAVQLLTENPLTKLMTAYKGITGTLDPQADINNAVQSRLSEAIAKDGGYEKVFERQRKFEGMPALGRVAPSVTQVFKGLFVDNIAPWLEAGGLVSGMTQRYILNQPVEVSDTAGMKIAAAMRKTFEEGLPDAGQSAFGGEFENALGQAVGTIFGAGIVGRLTKGTVSLANAGGMYGSAYGVAAVSSEAYNRAKQSGATEDQANLAAALSAPFGLVEGLSERLLLGKLANIQKLDKLTDGQFSVRMWARFKDIGKNALEQGATEWLLEELPQVIGSEAVAQFVYQKDKRSFDQFLKDIDEAIVQSAIAFPVGAIVGGGGAIYGQMVQGSETSGTPPRQTTPTEMPMQEVNAVTPVAARAADVQPTGETRAKNAATQPPPSPTTAVPSQPAPMGSQALEADTDAQGTVSDVQVEAAQPKTWRAKDIQYTVQEGDTTEEGRRVLQKPGTEGVSDPQILKDQLTVGQKVTFFAEKERTGTFDGNYIRDDQGQPWGIMGILADSNGWIRPEPIPSATEQPTPPRKRAEKYHDKPVRGMVLEAPLDPQTLTGAKNRLKEVETELQEERRKGSTDAKMGISNERAWQAAVDRIEADPEQEVVSLDINRMKEANDTTSHTGIDKNVLAPIGAAVRKVLKANGIDERNAFRTGGDEIVVAVPKGIGAKIRDEIEKEVGVIEVTATKDFTNDRTGESFKKGDRIPVTISGEVGLTVAEAEKGLGARKRASKDANPVRRVSQNVTTQVASGNKTSQPKQLSIEQTNRLIAKSPTPDPDTFIREVVKQYLPSVVQRGKQEFTPQEFAAKLAARYDTSNPQTNLAYSALMNADPSIRISRTEEGVYVRGRFKGNMPTANITLPAPSQSTAKGQAEQAREDGAKSPSYRKRLTTIRREMKDEFRARRQDGRELPNDLKSAGKRTDKYFEKALDKYVDGMTEPFIRDWHDTILNKDDSGILRQVASVSELDTIFNDKGDIDYEALRDVAERVASGSLEIKRFDPEIERGRIAGGQRNVEATLIIAANEAASQKSGSRIKPSERQERVLEKYAKHEGIWFDVKDFVKEQQGFISKGVEAYVHRADDSFVYKLVDYKRIETSATPLNFIDRRISLFNHFFPETAYELVGFTRDGDGDFRFVVKQPFIRDAIYTSPVERQAFMRDKGFAMTDKYGEAFASRLFKVHDLHEKNALKDEATGTILVIDAVPKLVDGVELDAFDVVAAQPEALRMAAGDARYDASEIEQAATNIFQILKNEGLETYKERATFTNTRYVSVIAKDGTKLKIRISDHKPAPNSFIFADVGPSTDLDALVQAVKDYPKGQPLFKLADDESKVYVRETLPTAHTQEVLRGVESKFTANNELELSEEAGEIVRRLLTHVNPSDKGRAFFGVTIDRATLRKAGNAAQKFADEYENIGYAESEVKALRDLGDNLIKLSKAESYGVAYIFEDALPEEQHHALVMNAGGISPEAITKLKKNPLWKSARLTREYGKLSDLSRAVEIAAKLETGQDKYWDKVSPKDKKAFLQTVADDIIDRNTDADGNVTLDPVRYERITKYAENKADNTEGTQRAGAVTDRSDGVDVDARTTDQGTRADAQEAQRPADEGDGDRAAEVSREDKGRRVAESETQNRQFARSLTKHLMDIADVPYTPQSFEKWADYADSVIADKGLDGAMDEWRSLSGQDNEGRRTALGVTIAKELMDAGRLGDYRTFGEELTNAVGNVAQELAAARMLSRLNPDFAPIHGDKITNKAHGRPQTPEEFAKTQRLAEELKDLADRELLAREGIAQAEERIKNLEEQNAELEQLLTDERKKSKGKSDAELAKALKTAKASLAYYKSLIDEKRKSAPKAVRTPEQIKKFKEKVEANHDEYRRRIQKAFGNAFGTVVDSDTLRMAVPLDDTSNPLGMDAELYEALVDLSADKILTGIEQGLTPEQFVTWLDKLTNNELSEYEKQYIHAAAFSQIRTSKPLTPEAKAKLKTRYAHARVANQILHAEEIAQRKAESTKRKDQRKEYRRSVREMEAAAINEGQAWTLDKFNRVMMNTAEKIDTSEEAVFIAVMIRNFGDMARIKQVYADAGLAPESFNKAFVEARNLIDFTKEEIERARVEGKTGIKNIAKNELNRFKAEEKITRKEKFLKLKELDTHYKDLTRSKTRRVAFGVLDAWNLVRAVQFSMDAGFALAQGGPTLITSPSSWFKAMKRGIPAAAETPALNRWLQRRGMVEQDQGLGDLFRRVPAIEKALRKAGFSGDKFMDAVVTEASSPYRARSEAQGVKYEVIGATQDWNESIMSKLSEKIPLVRQSNLAHSLVGDLFRLNQAERYLKWLDQMEADGKLSAFERNRAEEFIMKKWVNVMTGKGYLGPLENVAWAAAQVMSAPRYTASAFQALYYGNPVRYAMLPKGARAIVAHDTAKLYAAGGSIILLLAALGWINLDPEDKDFLVIDANKVPGLRTAAPDMKISLVRWLKESFRLTFGLGIKYAAYQAMGNQDAADRIERQWFNELVASDFGGIGNYWRGRMHPAISTIRTNVTGTNFVGDPVGWEDAEEWLPMPLSIKETVGALKYDRRESILKSGKANPNPSENVKRMLLSVVGNGIGLGMNSYPSTDTTVSQKQAQAMMGRGGDMRSDEEKAANQKANQLERAIREGYDVTEELTAALAKGQITTKQARALQATFANEIGKFQRDFGVRLTENEKALLMSHRRAFKIIDYLWGQGFQLDRDKIERALKFATKEENTLNDRAAQAEAEAILLRALLRSKKTSKPKK